MAKEARERARSQASRLRRDPAAAGRLAQRASARAERFREQLGPALDEVRALSRLVRAWASGAYRQVPAGTLTMALLALAYFLMPMDAVPDFIVGLGFLDDVAVIGQVVRALREDLSAFRDWEARQTQGNNNNDG